ncbi:MAG: hypothetical protein K6B17_10355 [Treponema sp.]|nr:hypothetical protein [Treponema sp.]
MRYNIIFILCSVFLFYSCNSQEYTYKDENIEINLELQSVDMLDDNTYKIKGFIHVKNLTENTYFFDLRNVKLKSEKNIQDRIYIDSIASRLIEPQKLVSHTTYNEKVYWIIHSSSKPVISGIDCSE